MLSSRSLSRQNLGHCNRYRATASDVRSLASWSQAKSTGYKVNAIMPMLQLMATMLMLLVPLQQLLAIMHKHSVLEAQATGVRTNVFGSDAAATADFSIAIW